MFLILMGILILGGILLIYQRLKAFDKKYFLYIGLILYIIALFIIPFFDPLQLPGFFASAILVNTFPSIYGTIVGIIVINCAIYGIHIFLSSMNLIKADRYKDNLIYIGQFSKRRHPIYASYHLVGLSYFVLMGSTFGVIILTISMVLLYLDTYKIEKNVLIPKFGDVYIGYKENVPKRLYSIDILVLLIVIYSLFIFGIIGILFFS